MSIFSQFNPVAAIIFCALVAVTICFIYLCKRYIVPLKKSAQQAPKAATGINQPSGDNKTPVLTGKYDAMIFTDDGIKFQKIPEKLKSRIYCEPSLPQHGVRIICVQKTDGTYEPYDPREAAIDSAKTPHMAYQAINWREDVKEVWAFPLALMQKINQILVWVSIGGIFFLAVMMIDKMVK